jgi:hypothetical protein
MGFEEPDHTPSDEFGKAPVRQEAAPFEHVASEAAAIVADRVRVALESAEREAAEVRRQALEHASDDRAAVHETAELVNARIDVIEAEVCEQLQELRDEVAHVVAAADRAAETSAAPQADAGDALPPLPPAPARRRRGGLFRRNRGGAVHCGVCGRTALDDDEGLDHWYQARGTSLCPQCQAAGWRIPEGGSVPHRPMQHEIQS